MRRLSDYIFLGAVILLTACGGGGGTGSDKSGGLEPPVERSAIVTDIGAIRFLEQATFGPTPESISRVKQIGFEAYIDEQFGLSESNYDRLGSGGTLKNLEQNFFANAINRNDQLRQRMAYSLGNIFVVSAVVLNNTSLQDFHQFLLENALSNYYDLLKGVSLHPSMGRFLDMVNNAAGNPNENYARELMQLFTLGLYLMNEDGSPVIGPNAQPTPAFNQNDVESLARALTGWTYATQIGNVKKTRNPAYFYALMEASEALHDYDSKTLFSTEYLPAGQTAPQDLEGALSAIYRHQNIAPYISIRLIQQFVTSNPSPDYIRRVSKVFNNNGAGVKGDLRAVMKAILLDEEARRIDYSLITKPADGKLKEPVLFITGLIRSLQAKSNGYELSTIGLKMGQRIFVPPSVFGYFPSDYRLAEYELYGPEFNLQTSSAIIHRINFARDLIYQALPTGTELPLEQWIALAADTSKLVDKIDMTLLRGLMTQEMRYTLTSLIDSIDVKNLKLRAQTGLYIVATSPQYSVQP